MSKDRIVLFGPTALLDAIESGDTESALVWISRARGDVNRTVDITTTVTGFSGPEPFYFGPRPSRPYSYTKIISKTPLEEAAKKGLSVVALALIEKGGDVATIDPCYIIRIIGGTDKEGRTALHLSQTKEGSELLLSKAPDMIKAIDNNGRSPLHTVVNKAVAELLIERGVDIAARDKEGRTAIESAVMNRKWDIVDLFIGKKLFDVNEIVNGLPLLYHALEDGDFETAKFLLDKGAKVDIRIAKKGFREGSHMEAFEFAYMHFKIFGQKEGLELLYEYAEDKEAFDVILKAKQEYLPETLSEIGTITLEEVGAHGGAGAASAAEDPYSDMPSDEGVGLAGETTSATGT